MSDVLDCPSCRRKLRRPDGVAGRQVQCPACGATFTAIGTADDVLLAEPVEDAAPAVIGTALGEGLAGLRLELDDVPAPARAVPPPPLPLRPRPVADTYDAPSRDRRRDLEPHRGGLILTLGVLSVLLAPTCVLSPLGVVFGLAAWIMGQNDLRQMRAGQMDTDGQANTRGGRVCGILGMLVGGALSFLCGLSLLAR